MQQFLTFCQAKIKHWRDQRFLKKHGCKTWEQYNRQYDPDYNIRASRVVDFYHGYKYWLPIENHNHLAYYWEVHSDGMYVLNEWCKENFQGKFRFDFLRVHKQTPYGLNGPEDSEWWINELGGSDYIFFACQEEQDLLWFSLKWGI